MARPTYKHCKAPGCTAPRYTYPYGGRPAWSRRIFMCGSVSIFIVRCDKCGQIEKIRIQGKAQRVTQVLKGKGVLE